MPSSSRSLLDDDVPPTRSTDRIGPVSNSFVDGYVATIHPTPTSEAPPPTILATLRVLTMVNDVIAWNSGAMPLTRWRSTPSASAPIDLDAGTITASNRTASALSGRISTPEIRPRSAGSNTSKSSRKDLFCRLNAPGSASVANGSPRGSKKRLILPACRSRAIRLGFESSRDVPCPLGSSCPSLKGPTRSEDWMTQRASPRALSRVTSG